MNDGRDAADEFGAHFSQRGHLRDQEGIQAHVADHIVPALLRRWPVAAETSKLRVFRDQYQLFKRITLKRSATTG